ncbi:MAG TPA: hypothetical protein VMN37_04985 [Gemmatimonadales bacterium]|nr:hypothetical protein [Gemmatimonadales bacterium]
MSHPRRARVAWGWLAAALAAVTVACQERLTEPAECPALCPGGPAPVFDTVLTALPGADTSHAGYIEAGLGIALLVSSGLPASESRAVYQFRTRPDSIVVADTNRGYLVDSVLLAINLLARDTLLDGLKLLVYRIDPEVDAGITFAELEPQLVEANLIDSVEVADTLNAGVVQLILRGADALKTGLPADSGGTLAIGVAISAPQPSGIRIGSVTGGTGAVFASYLTAQNVPDTVTARKQTDNRTPAFNTFVNQTTPVPEPDLLTLGGEPSSRALIRFDLPERLQDSATIVRATLELMPARPILGLPTDPALLVAKAVLADLGAKSPVTSDLTFIRSDTLTPGVNDTVRLDVTNLVRLWQSTVTERPEAIFLSLLPEAATFMRAEFGSSRTPEIGTPRLRITYMLAFPFENP